MDAKVEPSYILDSEIAHWSRISVGWSVFKLALYFASFILLASGIMRAEAWYTVLSLQMVLGLVMAHGLELQHECLHHNMFRSVALNRVFGFLFGLPMIVSYTHYQRQHLHHHKYVGTEQDQELFNYAEADLKSWYRFISRAWNFSRIPSFLRAYWQMWRGDYPSVVNTGKHRKFLFQEYTLLSLGLIAGIVSLYWSNAVLMIWFIPWLAFGELSHYIIELPEHLGCDKHDEKILNNTRSIRTNSLLAYLVNGNNYHMEHHLYPKVAMHRLRHVHERIFAQVKTKLPTSYFAFFSSLVRERMTRKSGIQPTLSNE